MFYSILLYYILNYILFCSTPFHSTPFYSYYTNKHLYLTRVSAIHKHETLKRVNVETRRIFIFLQS